MRETASAQIRFHRQIGGPLSSQGRLGPGPCRRQPIADLGEQRAVRLARPCSPIAQLAAARGQRQLFAQRVHLVQVQIGGNPAREPCRLTRHVGRHRSIAVAVSSNPRTECDRRGPERQRRSGDGQERAIEAAQVRRHRLPETLFEDDETGADLVERRYRVVADLVRLPDQRDLPLNRLDGVVLRRRRQIGVIERIEQSGDAVVLL